MAKNRAEDKFAAVLRKADGSLLKRALLRLYQKQTVAERQTRSTFKRNGIGFDRNMAPTMSRFAEMALSGDLTGKHLRMVRQILPSYSGQLRDLALEHGLTDD